MCQTIRMGGLGGEENKKGKDGEDLQINSELNMPPLQLPVLGFKK